jgi:hypothetical protein
MPAHFLIYAHSNFTTDAIALGKDIIWTSHQDAKVFQYLPTPEEIQAAVNDGRRVLIVGHHEVVNNLVTERKGEDAQICSRVEFLASIAKQ